MKAFCIHEPGRSALIECPKPSVGPGEVLLSINVVGFCGSDLTTFRGLNPMVSYPRIPGHEVGGTIVELGEGVDTQWSVGQQVLVSPYTNCGSCSSCRQGRFNCCRFNETLGVQRDGAMTEFLAIQQEKLFAAPGLTLAEMALVEPLTVGFHAVDRGRRDRDRQSSPYLAVVPLVSVSSPAQPTATLASLPSTSTKTSLSSPARPVPPIPSNPASKTCTRPSSSLPMATGPDVIVEAVGLPRTFRGAVEEVCFAGRVVYIGYAKAAVEYETKYFVQKEIDIMGSRNATPEDFKTVISMLQAKRFPVADAITQTVSLEQASDALQAWSDNPADVTKIQLAFASE